MDERTETGTLDAVTVLTPSLPERADMLGEVIADIAAQTWPASHLIGIDTAHVGPARIRNQLLAAVETQWVAFVDDDDRVSPEHIATLMTHRADHDIIYSLGRVSGREWEIPHDCTHAQLASANTIPVTALVRTSTLRAAGGFPEDEKNEDHALWRRLINAGARFQCVHAYTWLYRFHTTNRSLH